MIYLRSYLIPGLITPASSVHRQGPLVGKQYQCQPKKDIKLKSQASPLIDKTLLRMMYLKNSIVTCINCPCLVCRHGP
jgi:hypothetical protein